MEFKTEEEYLNFINETVTNLKENSDGTDFVLIASNDKFPYRSIGAALDDEQRLIPFTWELIHFTAEKLKMKPEDLLGRFLAMIFDAKEK